MCVEVSIKISNLLFSQKNTKLLKHFPKCYIWLYSSNVNVAKRSQNNKGWIGKHQIDKYELCIIVSISIPKTEFAKIKQQFLLLTPPIFWSFCLLTTDILDHQNVKYCI